VPSEGTLLVMLVVVRLTVINLRCLRLPSLTIMPQDLDSTDTTFSAAGTFCTSTVGSSGGKVVVGVLLRLESNQQVG
jgi:hypothetical protein